MHVFLVHRTHQAADGLNHNYHIASLHRDDHIHEALGDKHAQKLHYTLDHASRSVAVTRHDAVAQTAMVYAQTHCSVVVAANLDERQQGVVNFL